jgi:uncharacterized protein
MNESSQFDRGVADFNAGRFFQAHEVWEELWLAAAEPEKTFLQGLIQVAAAFHHQARGNVGGAQSLLAAGLAKLTGCPDDFRGVAMVELRHEVENWVELLRGEKESRSRDVPRIHVRAGRDRKKNAGDE